MDFKDNGLAAWEENASFWDDYMGNESNFFHCEIVRPNVEKLLEISEHDLVLDIACGNGNFSQRMEEQGAKVIAFEAGFILDGFYEVPFHGEDVPIIMICRLRRKGDL